MRVHRDDRLKRGNFRPSLRDSSNCSLPVTIGEDMGKEVEILNGLHGSEPLVSSPSDLLNEGDHVEVR